MIEAVFPTLARAAASGTNLARRRLLFATLAIATICGVLWLAALALAPGGIGALDIALLALLAVTLPWTVIGFWNAVIGFVIMRCARDPVAAVFPASARVSGNEPISASTAVLLCIRNELPERVVRNLEPMLADLVATGAAEHFHVYVLSDTTDPASGPAEETRFRRAGGGVARAHCGHLSPAQRQSWLQGWQHPGFLRALRRRATISPSRSTPTASCRRPPCCGWCA